MFTLKKIVVTTLGSALLIGGGVGIYSYLNGGLPQLPRITSDAKANAQLSQDNAIASAKLVPANTFITTYIDTDSQEFTSDESQKFVKAGLKNLNQNFSENDKITYDKDLKPWVDDVTIALSPPKDQPESLQEANILMVVGIKDKSPVENLLKKLEEQERVTVNSIDYQNQTIKEIKGKGSPEYITLINEKYLLFSSSESAIEQAIDTSNKGEAASFLSKIGTVETIENKIQLEDTRVKVFIPDYQRLVDNFIAIHKKYPEKLRVSPESLETLNNFKQVKSVIASIGVNDNGLIVKANANLDPKQVKSESEKTTGKEFSQFPGFTIGLISVQGKSKWWQALNKNIPELNSMVNQANQELTSANKDLSFSIEPLLAEANQ
ncbi:DUF3352 domain-containing protein [Calothrix sp. CCY 0018]|uniref:DUF3352 domain-containing protein n=1 Tax=Calothrix sp. CCY 0018 TaxID=3103864 RepID=UPI0039C6E3D2